MTQDNRKSQVEHEIDENLRKVYRRLVEQKVPDRFRDLLDELREGGTADPPEQPE